MWLNSTRLRRGNGAQINEQHPHLPLSRKRAGEGEKSGLSPAPDRPIPAQLLKRGG